METNIQDISIKNDVVIIHEHLRPRHLWQLGRIVDVVKGCDGVIRGAKIKWSYCQSPFE